MYESNGPFAYIRAFKSYVNCGFWRNADEIDEPALAAFVKDAVRLNADLGDPPRRAR